jgi:hypothetical protein
VPDKERQDKRIRFVPNKGAQERRQSFVQG